MHATTPYTRLIHFSGPASGFHGLLTAALARCVHQVAEDPPAPKLADVLKGAKFEDVVAAGGFQDHIDQLIEKRLARARKDGGGGGDTGLTEAEKQELEKLRQATKAREQQDLEEKKRYDAIIANKDKEYGETLKARDDEYKGLLSDYQRAVIDDALLAEAAAAGATNAHVVAKVLKDRVRLDKKRKIEVLDADGDPMLKGGKPLTIKQLLEAAKVEYPMLFKADADGEGAGGSGGKGGKSTDDQGGEGDPESLSALETELKALEEEQKKIRESAQTNPSQANLDKGVEIRRKIKDLKAKIQKKKAGGK